MPRLPDRPNSIHLKKQAKDLLRAYRSGDPDAIARFGRALPSARNLSPDDIVSRAFRLHDAQSCIAREYGFASWDDLTTHVEAQSLMQSDRAGRLRGWLALVYGGDVTGSLNPARPRVAVRVLLDAPDLAADDPYAACAAGNEAVLRHTAAADLLETPAGDADRPGGAVDLLDQQPHHRRLSRARAADEENELAAVNRERGLVEPDIATGVELGDRPKLDHRRLGARLDARWTRDRLRPRRRRNGSAAAAVVRLGDGHLDSPQGSVTHGGMLTRWRYCNRICRPFG